MVSEFFENPISKTEMLIMRVVWKMPGATREEIYAELLRQNGEGYDVRIQALGQHLSSLVRLGFVRRWADEKDRRMTQYEAVVDKDEYMAKQIKNLCCWYDETADPWDVCKRVLRKADKDCCA